MNKSLKIRLKQCLKKYVFQKSHLIVVIRKTIRFYFAVLGSKLLLSFFFLFSKAAFLLLSLPADLLRRHNSAERMCLWRQNGCSLPRDLLAGQGQFRLKEENVTVCFCCHVEMCRQFSLLHLSSHWVESNRCSGAKFL